jgi:hypothetical protein
LGVAVDATGIYAVGYADGNIAGSRSGRQADAFIRKYDSAGNVLWTRQFGSIFDDAATAVGRDPSVNLPSLGMLVPNWLDFTIAIASTFLLPQI